MAPPGELLTVNVNNKQDAALFGFRDRSRNCPFKPTHDDAIFCISESRNWSKIDGNHTGFVHVVFRDDLAMFFDLTFAPDEVVFFEIFFFSIIFLFQLVL